MTNGIVWCYICKADKANGEKVPDEDLFPLDCEGWEDDMANTENAITEYLVGILPDDNENCWQFEIGADAFSGVLDYSLKNTLPEIPPFTFTLRNESYTIYFPHN
jgi:hypothetical protein